MFVPADDEIDAVLVEQRPVCLAQSEVRAVEICRAHHHLVHRHDDPVDLS
jgi:hypothetical protein